MHIHAICGMPQWKLNKACVWGYEIPSNTYINKYKVMYMHILVPFSDWCPNFSFLCLSTLSWLWPPFDPHWIRMESNAGESMPGDRVRCWWAWLWAGFAEEGWPNSGTVVREWVRLRAAGCITGRHILEERRKGKGERPRNQQITSCH